MKISETTSYAHPVLAPWSGDIPGASIHTEFMLRENGAGQQVDLHCSVRLDHPELPEMINDGTAEFGCFVTCRDTGFRRLQRMGFPEGTHQFAPGALFGRVQLRPIVWTAKPVSNYLPAGAHQEFSVPADLEPGQILALDDEQEVTVLRPPVPSIESIFEILSSEEVAEGEFVIDEAGDRIEITMAPATYALVQSLRQTDDVTRTVVMNAMFVPVVMEVVHRLAAGQEEFEQCRWFEPFRRRCEDVGVDMAEPDLFSDAQKLLSAPFAGLNQLIDAPEDDLDD